MIIISLTTIFHVKMKKAKRIGQDCMYTGTSRYVVIGLCGSKTDKSSFSRP